MTNDRHDNDLGRCTWCGAPAEVVASFTRVRFTATHADAGRFSWKRTGLAGVLATLLAATRGPTQRAACPAHLRDLGRMLIEWGR